MMVTMTTRKYCNKIHSYHILVYFFCFVGFLFLLLLSRPGI